MTSYVNTFGGGNINPTDLSYTAITISANTNLVWPAVGVTSTNILTDKLEISATTSSLNVYLPPANLVSVGQDALIYNAGSNSFNLLTNTGVFLVTVSPGQSLFMVVRDNSSASGSWRAIRFGVGTSSADASALSGYGLLVLSGLLNTSHPVSSKSTAYTVLASDRAKIINSTGGSTTFSITDPATLGEWFCFIKNSGSGSLTVTPLSGTIDGAASKSVAIGESLIVISDGTNLITAFHNAAASTAFTNVNINVAGTGTSTLTASEVAARIQNYIGALTGNRIINYGTSPGSWYVYNGTSGAFTLTLRVDGSDAGVVLAAGTRNIIVSNGTNIVSAISTSSGTVTSIVAGAGLSGGTITTSGTIDITNTGVTASTYGSDVIVPVFTVNARGQITSVTNTAITFPSASIADGSITAIKLASDSVTTAKILDANVTTAKIADGNVTAAKLASGVAVSNIGYTPLNKAGDSMSGNLVMSGATTITASGSSSTTTGVKINSGTDIGSLFVRDVAATNYTDTGSGSRVEVTGGSVSLPNAYTIRLNLNRTFYDFPSGGGGT